MHNFCKFLSSFALCAMQSSVPVARGKAYDIIKTSNLFFLLLLLFIIRINYNKREAIHGNGHCIALLLLG